MGKRTAQRDTIKDITSDSQVNSYFPYRWSSTSLTFNIYFYLFSYLYITRITISNDTTYLKSPKNRNRRAALGRPAINYSGTWTSLLSTKSQSFSVIALHNVALSSILTTCISNFEYFLQTSLLLIPTTANLSLDVVLIRYCSEFCILNAAKQVITAHELTYWYMGFIL